MQRFVVSIAAIAFMLLGAAMANAEPSLAQLKTELVSAWLVTVDGESRTRTLKISGVEQREGGIFPLDAVYGWSNGNQTAVKAEITQAGQERTLLLTTKPGSKIAATQLPDGSFVGKFVFPDGTTTKAVRLEKVSTDELRRKLEASLKGAEIIQPTGDVPAKCAAFSGKWEGTWTLGSQDTLWVVAVDANCLAKVAYGSNSSRVAPAEITGGTLTFGTPLCAREGTCSFELQGDQLWARYSNPAGGWGTAVFRKVQ